MKINTDSNKIEEILTRGVEKVIEKDSLIAKLQSGKQLRIKHGVDPTTKDLHLGYAVVYKKLKDLQDMGHRIIFLIGDFTARFGDPTQKMEARIMRDKKKVMTMAENYIKQAGQILDIKRTEVRYNGEWYDKMSAEELLKLKSHFTHARLIERDMFQERIKSGAPIGAHEIDYPVLQGYDSVMLKSDLTVIGTDQIFNELCGRQLQEAFNQKPQDLLAMRILVGTDGHQKMSQSLGNYIAFNDEPNDMFGKIMSMPDEMIVEYFELLTRRPMDEIKIIQSKMASGALNPRDAKADLAKEIVATFHNQKEAEKAAEEFNRIFSQKEMPADMPEVKIDETELPIIDLLIKTETAPSKAEAKRLVEQGGVHLNRETVSDWKKVITIKNGMTLQVGKRRFVKIIK